MHSPPAVVPPGEATDQETLCAPSRRILSPRKYRSRLDKSLAYSEEILRKTASSLPPYDNSPVPPTKPVSLRSTALGDTFNGMRQSLGKLETTLHAGEGKFRPRAIDRRDEYRAPPPGLAALPQKLKSRKSWTTAAPPVNFSEKMKKRSAVLPEYEFTK